MTIIIKEITVKAVVERSDGNIITDEMLRKIKRSILREIQSEKNVHKTVRKER